MLVGGKLPMKPALESLPKLQTPSSTLAAAAVHLHHVEFVPLLTNRQPTDGFLFSLYTVVENMQERTVVSQSVVDGSSLALKTSKVKIRTVGGVFTGF
jgi:hypothetical protein